MSVNSKGKVGGSIGHIGISIGGKTIPAIGAVKDDLAEGSFIAGAVKGSGLVGMPAGTPVAVERGIG